MRQNFFSLVYGAGCNRAPSGLTAKIASVIAEKVVITMTVNAAIGVIVVSFKNPTDVVCCLNALQHCETNYQFDVYIAENGGKSAYEETINSLHKGGYSVLETTKTNNDEKELFYRTTTIGVRGDLFRIYYGECRINLGYAGGINAWIRRLSVRNDFMGYWILNPDTIPNPGALAALVTHSKKYNKGMVGSRLMAPSAPDRVQSRGLKWSLWGCRTIGVDKFASSRQIPDRRDVEDRIDAPSGASFYISSECLRRIGLMDESYFLYFEDLDWGLRAKASGGVGYAFDSVVPHIGGTTLGSSSGRRQRSQLAVYLDFRNRLLFVRNHYPRWFLWTAAMVLARAFEFLAIGAFTNFRAALAGWSAGLRGETGRPDRLMDQHIA